MQTFCSRRFQTGRIFQAARSGELAFAADLNYLTPAAAQKPHAFQTISLLLWLQFFIGCGTVSGADPFAEFVRSTAPRSPQDELKGFHLPPGFEAQLVASDPEIGKPMTMALDHQRRLSLTQSREYPFPVPLGTKGR